MDNNIEENNGFRHRSRVNPTEDNQNKPLFVLRNILNIIFMLLAIAGVAIYLLMPRYETLALLLMITAVFIKFAEASIRLFRK